MINISSKSNNAFAVNPYLHRFCWHLRFGICRKVAPERISGYARFFYREYLENHLVQSSKLADELSISQDTAKKMKAIHRKINRLFEYTDPNYHVFGQIEDKVDEYARFSRKSFLEFQKAAVTGQIRPALYNWSAKDPDVNIRLGAWKDKFWELESPQPRKQLLL